MLPSFSPWSAWPAAEELPCQQGSRPRHRANRAPEHKRAAPDPRGSLRPLPPTGTRSSWREPRTARQPTDATLLSRRPALVEVDRTSRVAEDVAHHGLEFLELHRLIVGVERVLVVLFAELGDVIEERMPAVLLTQVLVET